MLLHYFLILSLSLFVTVKSCLPKWQKTSKTPVICKTALDCPQEEPHVCQNGICKAYSAIKHRKPAKMTSVCSTFLDCSPGLICSKGRCIKE